MSSFPVNASLYDIREYFRGRNPAGKMNNTSEDEKYTELIANLRTALKVLAKQIEPEAQCLSAELVEAWCIEVADKDVRYFSSLASIVFR